MSQLERHGKGIILILMHDFKRHTAQALPELIRQLKARGYKVVQLVPKGELTTVPKYEEMLAHDDKLSSNNTRLRAASSVRSASSEKTVQPDSECSDCAPPIAICRSTCAFACI
jgi:hypothetical protein